MSSEGSGRTQRFKRDIELISERILSVISLNVGCDTCLTKE